MVGRISAVDSWFPRISSAGALCRPDRHQFPDRDRAFWMIPADSKEGMEILFRWARATGAVLDEWHERLAKKYDVPTSGVVIRHKIPEGK